MALREIADERFAPEDMREDLIHSLQKHVEVDEPEAEAVPAMTPSAAKNLADPEASLSFGYTMNRMGAGILLNTRGQSLVDAVYACAER